MRIATWNVNSIKARREVVTSWLKEADYDVVCLQEIKCVDEAFPADVFEQMGYNVAVHGQKTYNGVALLSKHPIEELNAGLPGDDEDVQARYLEAVISVESGVVRVASIYLPNGNPLGTEKFDYKLAWMARLRTHTTTLLGYEEPLVLAGDYNLIPSDNDVYDPAGWEEDALYHPKSRALYHELLHLGLTDAFRACNHQGHQFTYWDYQRGAWQKDRGLRIDHLLLSPQAADRLRSCAIDRIPRGWEKPSDHTPIWAQFAAQ